MLGQGVHVEREVKQLSLILGQRRVDVVVELRELIDIVPNLLVGSMEDAGSLLVNVNTFFFLTVDITADMVAFVDDLDIFPRLVAS